MNYNQSIMRGLLAVLFIAAMPLTLLGQPRTGHGERRDAEVMRKIEELRKVRILEGLKMNDSTAVKFLNRWNDFHAQMRALQEKRIALTNKLDGLLKDNAPNADIDQTLAQLNDLAKEQALDRISFLDGLRAILTPRQIATMLVIERDFEKEVRKVITNIQRQKMRGRLHEGE